MKTLTLVNIAKVVMIKFVAALALAAGAGLACADDTAKLAQTCVACHGPKGVSSNPLWPNLAGQHEGYLADQIRAFRDGERINVLMMPMVRGLSDQQIADLAAYFSGLSVPKKKVNELNQAGRSISGRCVSCHGMEGKPVNTEWPIIAGQQAAYLEKQLIDFRDGNRPSDVMSVIVKGFTDQQIADVAAYYSQFQGN